jgi:sulfur carrier protein ThiS
VPVTVGVTFLGALRRFLPEGAPAPHRYVLGDAARVADLLAAIGVDPALDLTVAVDGELADRDALLRDGAEVLLLSPMEGGT